MFRQPETGFRHRSGKLQHIYFTGLQVRAIFASSLDPCKIIAMKTLFTVLTACLIHLNALAQSGNTISGTVKDAGNQSLPGATVRLLKTPDSTLVTGETTDVSGNFHFIHLENGTYMLAISAMGQKDFRSGALTIDAGHSAIALPAI